MKHTVLKRMLAAMLALSFIFSTVPEDILTFNASAWEEPRSAVVDFESDTVGKGYSSTTNTNKGAEVLVENDPHRAGGKSLKVTSNNWNQAAIIPIYVPYKLSEYTTVSFEFTWLSSAAPTGNARKFRIYAASSPDDFITNQFGNDNQTYNDRLVFITDEITDLGTSAHGNGWTTKVNATVSYANVSKDLQGDIYLAIGMHTNVSGVSYMIDNITFTLRNDFTLPGSPGAVVSVPTIKSKNARSITANNISAPATGQSVEYGISTSAEKVPSKWQDSPSFNGLAAETTYYIFARSKANASHRAGQPSAGVSATTDASQAPVPVTAGNGAAETGVYRNLFKEFGFSDEEIDERLQRTYNRLFDNADGGEYNIYVESGADMAYIYALDSDDVRSEGMSYGMMMTLQMNDQTRFDKLWKWAHTYMLNKEGDKERRGYFAWSCSTSGNPKDKNPAPDGEMYFATALLFASNRWGDKEGIFEYGREARKILYDLINRRPGEFKALFNLENKLPIFSPQGNEFTDASYHLPQFFDIWAEEIEYGEQYWDIWDNDINLVLEDAQFYRDSAAECRKWLKEKGTHPTTGLSSDYAQFDGTPQNGGGAANSHLFSYDSWRTAMNIAVDYSWWAKDPWQIEHAVKIQEFFSRPEVNPSGLYSYGNKYEINGTPSSLSDGHSMGLVAGNAVTALSSNNELSWAFIEHLWNLTQEKGTYRYYGGCLYMFAMLQLSGNYRAYYSTGPGDGTKSRISATKAYFDKSTSGDIDVTVTLNGNTLTNIKNGGTTLSSGTHYTVSGSTLTIKSGYLSTLPDGTSKLTFNFSNSQAIDLSVSVEDTSVQILGRKFDEKITIPHTVVTNVLETSFPEGQNVLKVKKTTGFSTAGVAVPIRLGSATLANYALTPKLYITMTARSNLSNKDLKTSVFKSKAEIGALGDNTLCANQTFSLSSGSSMTFELPITISNAASYTGDIYVAFGISESSYEYDISYVGLVPKSKLTKADGAAVSGAPAVSGSPTATTIEVSSVTATGGTGQTVQYAISTSNSAAPNSLLWQSGTVFNGLTPETTYYVYARTAQNAGYYAGAAQVSSAISTIGLQNGAAVTTPTVSGTPTASSITVNAVSLQPATSQSIQYAISTSDSADVGALSWQTALTFNGLTASTNYYVYARSVANETYKAGTASISAAIKTADLTPGSALSGVPTVNGDPASTVITINALTLQSTTGQTIQYAISTNDNAEPTSLTWQTDLTFTGLTPETTYYVYARAAQNTTYAAGAMLRSDAITTPEPPPAPDTMLKYDFSDSSEANLVEFNTNRAGGTKATWKETGVSGEPGVIEVDIGAHGDMVVLPFDLGSYTLGDVDYINIKIASVKSNTSGKSFGVTASTTGVFDKVGYSGNQPNYYVVLSSKSGSAGLGSTNTWNSAENQKYTVDAKAAADLTGEIKLGFSALNNAYESGGAFQISEVELVLKAGVDPGPTQQAGALVQGVPTVSGSPTASSITVSTVTLQGSTGQSIQYAISTSNNADPAALTWGSATTFDNLTAGTTYYVYARSAENTSYKAGTPAVSAAIQTDGLTAGSDVSEEPTVNGDPTESSITVSAVTLATPATGQTVQYAISTSASADLAQLSWQTSTTFNGLNPQTTYYVYARAAQSDTHAAGAVKVSDAIATIGTPAPATMLKYDFSENDTSFIEFNTNSHSNSKVTWMATGNSGESGVIQFDVGQHGDMIVLPFNLGNYTLEDVDYINIKGVSVKANTNGKDFGVTASTTGVYDKKGYTENQPASYYVTLSKKTSSNSIGSSWNSVENQKYTVTPGNAANLTGKIKLGFGALGGYESGGAYQFSEIEIVMKESAAPSPELSPESAEIDVGTTLAPITVNMTLNGNTLTAIKNGSTTLTQGTDYTVSGTQVQINTSYLSTLAKGKVTLSFEFASGKTKTFTINVKDSNAPPCIIIPPSIFKPASTMGTGTVTTNSGDYPVSIKYGDANYENVYSYFDVTFPRGGKLSDYSKVKAVITTVGGDATYKDIGLFAGTTTELVGKVLANSDSNPYLIANRINIQGLGTYNLEYTIGAKNPSKVQSLDSEAVVRLSIFGNINNSSGTEYRLSNVIFHLAECDGNCVPEMLAVSECDHISDNAQASDCTQPNKCSKCGEILKDAIEHTLVWGKNDTNHWQQCSVCNTYTVSATAHDFSGYTVVKPQTCISEGERTRTCQTTGCGYVETSDYGAYSGHTFSDDWTVDTAATCTTAGSESKKCTTQGCTEKSEVRDIPALGHNFTGTETVTQAATCGAEGSKTIACVNPACGETTTVAISATGSHNYVLQKDSTDHWEQCSVCQAERDRSSHTYSGYSRDNDKHWQVCTKEGCGHTTAEVACAGGTSWVTTDDTNHWKVCTTCNGQYDKAEHNSNNANATDCAAASTCTTCSKVLVAAGSHNYQWQNENNQHWQKCANSGCTAETSRQDCSGGDWVTTDGTNHWKVCTTCSGQHAKAAHNSNNAKASNCTQDSVCTTCDRVMDAKNASHSLYWTKDGANHWQACYNCTIKLSEGTHNYSTYSHDATKHWQVCTQAGCGNETAKTDCTGGSWQTNAEYHWKECTICANELNKASHSSNNGNENDCLSSSLCLDCGKELKPAGSHNYQWLNDDNNHWQKCSKCGDEQNRATHEFNGYTNEDGQHWQVCTEPDCAKETTRENCIGGDWITTDEANHWKECNTCANKLSEGAHVSDGANGGDCTQASKCETCQKVMKEAGSHNYVWDNNGTQHWEKCSGCGHERNRASHAYSGYSYENNEHWRECTGANCNHKTAKVSCVPGSWVTTDPTNHWQKCTACPNEMNKDTHTSNNANADNCTHDSVCTTCAKVMTPKNASHTFKWEYDENGHWQKCDNCPIKQNGSTHSLGGYEHDTDGHWQECNSASCDYKTAEVPCTPGTDWVTDGSNHWNECTACSNKLNTGAHDSDEAKKDDCTQNSVCKTCAKVMAGADASHFFKWETNGSQHWEKCNDCPVEQNRADHAYSGYSHANNQHWQVCTQAGCGHTTAKENCSGGTWVTNDPTNHWKVCSSCANQYEKANHTWTDGTGTEGFPNDTNHRCSCGRAVAHSYGDYEQVTAATCQSKGERTRTCQTSGCGHIETSEYPDYGAHNYTAAHTVDTPATCTTAGEESRKCQTENCTAKTGVKEITALGHNMQQTTVDAATCTNPQVTHYECSRADCNVTSHSNTASALGHDWGAGWTLKADQSGATYGYKIYERYCSHTGCTYNTSPETKEVAECPGGGAHDFTGAGEITRPATCAESGERTITCSNNDCTAQIVQSIPATGAHTSNGAQTTNCLAPNECTGCGIVITPAKAGHSSINDAKSADCTQDSVCTDCGVKVETKNDAHTLSWVYNNYNHWQECANCTTILNDSPHSYSGYEKSATQHWQVCTEANCAYTTDKTAHVSNEAQKTNCLVSNDCKNCGAVVDAAKTEHNSNLAHKADCTEASICDDCNTELEAASAGHVSNNAQAANCLVPNTCQNCTTIITPAKSSHESDNKQADNCLEPNTCKHCPTVMNVAKQTHNSDNANASDCTQNSVCRDCKMVLVEAGSHNSDNAHASDCTKASQCLTCNKILAAAGEHNSDNANASDCTKASKCTVCSKELAAAGNHTSDNAQTLNCEDPNTCTVCDTVINEGKDHNSNNAHESDCTAASVCTECSQELASAGSHDYVWQSDGTKHWQYCDTCETKTAEVNCAGGTWVTSDGINHWKVCATCSKEYAKASHISDGAHTSDCTKASKCTVCTKVLLAAGNHSYEWQSDGTQHWQHCSTCQKDTAKVNCSGGTWVTSNATDHWKVCGVCKKDYSKSAHTSDGANEKDCTAASECTVCKKVLEEAGSHSYVWHSDNNQHWQVCSNTSCNHTTAKANCAGGTWTSDGDNHWKVCETCSKDYAKAEHDSDNAHASDCTKASKCTVCTKELVAAGTHTSDNAHASDCTAASKCTVCTKELVAAGSHSYVWHSDGTQHWQVCSIESCNNTTAKANCAGGTLKSDDTNHWRVCTTCSKDYAKAAHTSNNANATNCTADSICTACQKVIVEGADNHTLVYNKSTTQHWQECNVPGCTHETAKVTCAGGTTWKSDGTNHWKVCTDPGCGNELNKTTHNLGTNGICTDCGFNGGSSVVIGDVNGDGKVLFADASMIYRYTASWYEYDETEGVWRQKSNGNVVNLNLDGADVNGDDKVLFADASMVYRYTAGWYEYDYDEGVWIQKSNGNAVNLNIAPPPQPQ